jgi:hypothetical protein
MFPDGLEFIAHERRKSLLEEAERMRLINSLERPEAKGQRDFGKVVHWMGVQMVKWGLKLQNYKVTPPSPARTVADVECPQC